MTLTVPFLVICQRAVLGIGVMTVLLALPACDQRAPDTEVGVHAPLVIPDRAAESVSSGVGGRSSGVRGWSDPLRYAYWGLPQRDPLQPAPLILYNDGYVIGYDMTSHLPLWACYRLFDTPALGSPLKESRDDNAMNDSDPRVTAREAATPAPAKAHERGAEPWLQLVPSAPLAACYGSHGGVESRLSSAQLPIAAPRGWADLIGLEPGYARSYHELWVMTGPILKSPVGSNPAIDAVWTIQVSVQQGRTAVQAFILPLSGDAKERGALDLTPCLTSCAAIAERTGLSFFPDLHDLDHQSRREVLTIPATRLWGTAASPLADAAH